MFPFIECGVFTILYFVMYHLMNRLTPKSIFASQKDATTFNNYLVSMIHCISALTFSKKNGLIPP